MSRVVWCWKSRYQCTATRPMFLNMDENCMYSGYEPNPSNLYHKELELQVMLPEEKRDALHIMIVNLA